MSTRIPEERRTVGPPPPAPPLPPQPSSARAAANAFARFAQNINYGSRFVTTTDDNHLRGSRSPGQTIQRSSSPVSSRTTSHKTGLPITSLDISPCRTRAILAGRDILKTVAVTGSTCSEDYNLRERIVRYAATHELAAGKVSAKHIDQLAANDVKWSHGEFHTTIATAAANGQIVVYDLNRAGVELARLHEHTRQVHRLGFNPHRGNLLLSGSQDATTRLWDLRILAGERSVMTCSSKSKYTGNSEGVRDLRWSPTNGVEFAIGTDGGVIQRWDIRKESSPTLKVNAHEKTCNAIDWHPDGKHLVSASADKTAKIWDFSSSDRRMKALWELRVPHAAMNVRWRPACWAPEDNRPGGWHCTQLAVSYDKDDPRIHIWDLRRPFVPFRVLDRFETSPTVLLWHSEDHLWSADSAGMFTQTDVRFAPNPMERRNVNPISVAPDGRIMFASMKRERRRLSIEDVTDNLLSIQRGETGKSGSPGGGHGSMPGSHEETSLLNSSFKNRRSKAPNSLKSARSIDVTPPSAGPDGAVLPLEQSLQDKYMYKNPQLIGVGYIPGLFDAEAFKFMARHYLPPPMLPAGKHGLDLHRVFSKTFMHNASVAALVGKHRLAQTWRILAQAVEKELWQRAEHNYQLRIAAVASHQVQEQSENQSVGPSLQDTAGSYKHAALDTTKTEPETAVSNPPASSNILPPVDGPTQEPLAGLESIDRIATLDQRPSSHSPASTRIQADRTVAEPLLLADVSRSTHVELAEEASTVENVSASSDEDSHIEPNPPSSPDPDTSTETGLGDLDRQIAERRAAMRNYRAQPRPVLKLDDPFQTRVLSLNLSKSNLVKSNKAFQISSASSISSPQAPSSKDIFETNRALQRFGNEPEEEDEEEGGRPEEAHEGCLAESAMASDDDAEIVVVQHSSSSPKKSVTPKRRTGKLTQKKANRSMPSTEAVENERPIVNFEDMHPFSKLEPLPADDVPAKGHRYTRDDFCVTLPDENDKVPLFPPWTATAIFLPLVNFHCESLSDSQLPAYLLLHLAPWLYVPMHPFRAVQILTTYHQSLIGLELYAEAAEIRLYCEDIYPQVSAYGTSVSVDTGGPWCTNCHRGSKGRQYRFCERCEKPWEDCVVCHGECSISPTHPTDNESVELPQDTKPKGASELWGWCPRCGHGGHTACLRKFWDFSEEGACPTAGCMCDCMPGKGRERLHQRFDEDWKKKPGAVAKDSWSVKESGAVRRTRSMVGATEAGKSILQSGRGVGRGDGSSGPQTLGATGRSASGSKKSVRFGVPPEYEGDRGKGKGKERVS